MTGSEIDPARAGSTSKQKKIGHRRVDTYGQVTYKKVSKFILPDTIQCPLVLDVAIGGFFFLNKYIYIYMMKNKALHIIVSFPNRSEYMSFSIGLYSPLLHPHFNNILVKSKIRALKKCHDIETNHPSLSQPN